MTIAAARPVKTALFAKAALLASAAMLATPAAAQDGEDGLGANDLEDEGAIIVTAQRREQNILDVPISVATVDEERLTAILDAGADIRGLAGRVPSLYVEGSSGRTAPRFYIRGLGNVDFDLSASQPVSIVSDEVVLENVLLKGFPIFDIEQTEILRGPQGTLFGRNTPAGIIKFDTKKPTDTFEGYLSASYGRFDSAKVNAAIGGPLGDNFGFRVAGELTHRDDFVENVNPGADFAGNNDGRDDLGGFTSVAGRAHFELDLANFNSLLTLQYQKLDGTTTLFRANVLSPGTNNLNDNFDRFEVAYDGGRNNISNTEIGGVTWKNELGLGDLTLTSITSYFEADSDGVGDIDGGVGAGFLPGGSFPGFIPFPSETGSRDTDLEQVTQELRLASDMGTFSWQLGAFYFRDEFTVDNASFDGFGNPEATIIALTEQTNESYAVFAQGSLDLTERLTLTAGVRYTDDDKDFVGSRPLGFLGPIDARVSVGDDQVNWDVALNYEATNEIALFTRVATGFRAPSIQGRLLFSNDVTTADSENVISIDAGIKAAFGNTFRISAAAFYYEVDDQQFTAIGGAGNFNQLINADKGVGKGFEIDANLRPVRNLDIFLGFSYNDTEIQDEGLLVAPCGAPCTVLDPLVTVDGTTRASIDGNPFPQAPETILTASLRYAVPLSGGELYFFTDYTQVGETNFFLYESREFRFDGNLELGVRAGYIDYDTGLEVAGFVRNLTNEENLIGAIDFNNLTGFVNDPLIWGVETRISF
ncbi:TonB-dependent receptor [Erythrobacter sp.]|jgi:iron complex outermembrane receptor protein|uniref:TonB-dependent receptor n=1 Tax=Erythrobacter sp. TaxID=1042 RepID=UPI002EADC0C7|nr:TonB-dependent receptor [Erythrobacter sp.]